MQFRRVGSTGEGDKGLDVLLKRSEDSGPNPNVLVGHQWLNGARIIGRSRRRSIERGEGVIVLAQVMDRIGAAINRSSLVDHWSCSGIEGSTMLRERGQTASRQQRQQSK